MVVRTKLLVLAVLLAGIVPVHATTYYIDFATGSDANNGTAKITPWKHAPAMNGSTIAGYVHAAGDIFIFKGGVTWDSTCFPWTISNSGTGPGTYDQYTIDATWFTGGAWTNPIFDGGSPVTPLAAAITVSGSYKIISYLKVQNFGRVGSIASGTALSLSNPDNLQVLHNIFAANVHAAIGITALTSKTANIEIANNDISATGWGFAGGMGSGVVQSNVYVHDNNFHDFSAVLCGGSAGVHGDGIYIFQTVSGSGYFDNFVVYNNHLYGSFSGKGFCNPYSTMSAGIWLSYSGGNSYIIGNDISDTDNEGSFAVGISVAGGGRGLGGLVGGNFYVWNNSMNIDSGGVTGFELQDGGGASYVEAIGNNLGGSQHAVWASTYPPASTNFFTDYNNFFGFTGGFGAGTGIYTVGGNQITWANYKSFGSVTSMDGLVGGSGYVAGWTVWPLIPPLPSAAVYLHCAAASAIINSVDASGAITSLTQTSQGYGCLSSTGAGLYHQDGNVRGYGTQIITLLNGSQFDATRTAAGKQIYLGGVLYTVQSHDSSTQLTMTATVANTFPITYATGIGATVNLHVTGTNGFEANGRNQSNTFTSASDLHLAGGSALAALGQNLHLAGKVNCSSPTIPGKDAVCIDRDGTSRPLAGGWAMGAYQGAAAPLNTLSVVTALGTVTSNDGQVNCTDNIGTCIVGSYSSGLVVLTAVPDTNYSFSGWSGDCAGVSTCTLDMSSSHSATASYSLNITTHNLTVTSAHGTVTSSPAGISCPATCGPAAYSVGQVVTLTATPAALYGITNWTGADNACTGLSSCTVTMSADSAVTVNYAAIVPPTISLTSDTAYCNPVNGCFPILTVTVANCDVVGCVWAVADITGAAIIDTVTGLNAACAYGSANPLCGDGVHPSGTFTIHESITDFADFPFWGMQAFVQISPTVNAQSSLLTVGFGSYRAPGKSWLQF